MGRDDFDTLDDGTTQLNVGGALGGDSALDAVFNAHNRGNRQYLLGAGCCYSVVLLLVGAALFGGGGGGSSGASTGSATGSASGGGQCPVITKWGHAKVSDAARDAAAMADFDADVRTTVLRCLLLVAVVWWWWWWWWCRCRPRCRRLWSWSCRS